MKWIATFFGAACLVANPSHAEEIKRIPAQLDPTKAYLVVELGQLDDAMVPASLVLARYDDAVVDVMRPGPAQDATRDGGRYRQNVTKHFQREGKRRLSLVAVEPGLWVVEGANDTAFSLGSSTMRLNAGSVTDLGVATIYTDFPDGEKRDVLTEGRMLKGALMGGIFGRTFPKPMPRAVDFRPRGGADLPLPVVLAAAARPVVWGSDVRFGNHLGGLVNRMGGRKARFRAHAAALAVAAAEPPLESNASPTDAPKGQPLPTSAPQK